MERLLEVRADGVAVITCGAPGAPVSTLRPSFGDDLGRVLREIAYDARIKAAILVSGHPGSFIADVDVEVLQEVITAAQGEALCRTAHRVAQRIEGSPKPIVAAIHGAALGGGFEVALACHARVLSDDQRTVLGLPEVRLGLLPAMCGLQRLARIAGLQVALDHGLTGKSMRPMKARRLGVAADVVPAPILREVAAAHALKLAESGPPFEVKPRKRGLLSQDAITEVALERNPFGRALLFKKARQELRKKTGGHYPAPERILEVLRVWADRGLAASQDVEARAFGELLVSSTAHRLMEVFSATTALKKDPEPAVFEDLALQRAVLREIDGIDVYTSRILAPYVNEAAWLITEGVAIEAIDRALVAWGFPAGPIALLDEVGLDLVARVGPVLMEASGARTRPPPAPDPEAKPPVPVEEIQMRCALQLVNEALRCLGEGVLRGPRDGDVGAIFGLGFPPFRGGPFRYVDSVGPAEVLRRIEDYRKRHGERWAPAPALVEAARSGKGIY